MAITVTHQKVNTVADDPTVSAAGGVVPSDWNATHAVVIDGIDNVPIGATTPSTGAFTTLSASSTVSGTGFSTYLASPPAIGGTAAAAGTFTTLSSTGNTTLGDASGDTVTINGTVQPGVVVSGSSTGAAVRITQTGSGNALLVEDDTNPDSTPFVVTATGSIGVGVTPDSFSKIQSGGVLSTLSSSNIAYVNQVSSAIANDNNSDTVVGYRTNISTSAGSYSVTNLKHFESTLSALGAGSSISAQYGFYAHISTVGATNNYGFFGGLTEATGRWNFYASGNAANYFEGATTFNTNLTVNGTTNLSGLTASTALALNASKNVVSVTNTGTGNNVLATSPVLTTPNLGTPSAITLTNATGLPVSTGISGLGTGVATALAVNTGSSGAFVTNGGALGTPSSGTVTNLTGTASININGTVGATTPSTGAFTTLSASSTVSGTGFSTYLASPPAIGGATAAAGTFTTLSSTGNTLVDGALGVGTTTVTTSKISMGGTLPSSGGNSNGIGIVTTIPSTSTGQTNGVGTYIGTQAAAFTAGQLFHFHASQGSIGAGSAITQQIGLYTATTLTGATTNYAVYADIAASGTSRWNFYAGGTAPNYFAGPVGVGATTTGDPLRIAGTINHAAFSNAQIIDATIGSSVTSSFRGVMSRPITQNAAFTLSNLIHFYVNPQAKGASSTITNQYGFFAESSITDATTNFGFYSNIASASQRWNFYAAGTAANYFAGNCFIGATTGDQALNVNGAVRVANITTANQTSAGTMDFTSGNMRFLVWGSSGVQGTFSWWTAPGGSGAAQRMALSGTTLTLGVSGSTTGALACTGSTSGAVTITSAAVAGTWTLTLPTSAGTNGYVLSTDGAGVTSWVAQSGGGGGGGSSVGSDIFLANSFGGF